MKGDVSEGLDEVISEARTFLINQGHTGDVDFQVHEFESGWLLSLKSADRPRFGGIRLIVDRYDRSVHSFPTSEPPKFTISKYLRSKQATEDDMPILSDQLPSNLDDAIEVARSAPNDPYQVICAEVKEEARDGNFTLDEVASEIERRAIAAGVVDQTYNPS